MTPTPQKQNIYSGNAITDGQSSKYWIVGNFMGNFTDDPNSIRIQDGVEIKWGIHQKGDKRDVWTLQQEETTISILISGKQRIIFADKEYILANQGDYL